ncbi:nucleoid-associated protein NdpA [Morganella morganii]|jgi:nucleoid-associated protein|uniref:nucleoid-associated protein n=1 Tax=Morganella morganii TaxID=582 RepID=UPI000DA3F866|nr:nucleoid-associated protein [Morganella morganii]WNP30063.1 nucleoid-associated protein [Morganella morganii]SQL16278.1 nucleoid-associated protein NdpA [Morganella morganii]
MSDAAQLDDESVICPACNSQHDSKVLCPCGYDPELEQDSKGCFFVEHAITATLEKKQTPKGYAFIQTIGKKWTLDSEDVLTFVTQINKKFKLKRKIHGVMDKNEMPLSPPSVFKKYLSKELDFSKFVSSVMNLMKREANEDKSTLVGGAIVLIHYGINNDKDNFGNLLVLMVDKKGVFNFDNDLMPEKLVSVDIDSLRQAVSIDLNLFNIEYNKDNNEPYLHFINGKSKSEFFKRALGCNPKLDNNRSIVEAKRAVNDFLKKIKVKPIDRVKVNKNIEKFIEAKSRDKNDKKTNLDELGKCIADSLPRNRSIVNRFNKFVDLGAYSIDEYFEPSPSSKYEFSEIRIVDEDCDYEVKFDIESISDDENSGKKIIYKKNGYLLVKLSNDSIQRIEKYIK